MKRRWVVLVFALALVGVGLMASGLSPNAGAPADSRRPVVAEVVVEVDKMMWLDPETGEWKPLNASLDSSRAPRPLAGPEKFRVLIEGEESP